VRPNWQRGPDLGTRRDKTGTISGEKKTNIREEEAVERRKQHIMGKA